MPGMMASQYRIKVSTAIGPVSLVSPLVLVTRATPTLRRQCIGAVARRLGRAVKRMLYQVAACCYPAGRGCVQTLVASATVCALIMRGNPSLILITATPRAKFPNSPGFMAIINHTQPAQRSKRECTMRLDLTTSGLISLA